MEIGTVGIVSMIGMIFALCVSIGLPVALIFIVRKKTQAKVSTFLIGGATFIVFALILERIMHTVVFGAAGSALTGNIWLYGLYGGLAAALFEETGRWIAMRFCMKKRQDLPNALMYGVGHGGTEAILILGLASVNNLITSVMVNAGMFERTLSLLDETTREATYAQVSALWTLPGYQFFLGGIERISAVALQIAMSAIMIYAVRLGKKRYWLLAFAIHFFVDFVTVVSANYLNLVLVEMLIAACAALVVYVAYRIAAANREAAIHD